jgi:hypothetical protein
MSEKVIVAAQAYLDAQRYGWTLHWRARSCCEGIQDENRHVLTAKHIANALGVDRMELLRVARTLRAMEALEAL